MNRQAAEILALRALAYLAADENVLQRLFALTGVSGDEVRSRAGDPEFQAGILDFLLQDEALLLQFCEATALNPELPRQAREVLARRRPGAAE